MSRENPRREGENVQTPGSNPLTVRNEHKAVHHCVTHNHCVALTSDLKYYKNFFQAGRKFCTDDVLVTSVFVPEHLCKV